MEVMARRHEPSKDTPPAGPSKPFVTRFTAGRQIRVTILTTLSGAWAPPRCETPQTLDTE
jgi:hypothetical protein